MITDELNILVVLEIFTALYIIYKITKIDENISKILNKEIEKTVSKKIIQLLKENKKIDAIKYYRESVNASLLDAEKAIQKLECEAETK